MSEGYVLAVAVIVFRGAKILAMRRSRKKVGAGLWETLSGRVEPDEEPYAAICREAREECGLDLVIEERPITAYTAMRGDQPMAVIVYRAQSEEGEPEISDEHDAYVWCSPLEFRTLSTLTKLVDAVDAAVVA